MDINSELKEAQLEVLDVDKAYSANTPALIWFNRAANKVKAMYNSVIEILATESYVNDYVANEISTTIQDNIEASEYVGKTVLEEAIDGTSNSSTSFVTLATTSATIGRDGHIAVEAMPVAGGVSFGYFQTNTTPQIRILVDGNDIGGTKDTSSTLSYFKAFATGLPEGPVTVEIQTKVFFPGFIQARDMKMVTTTY